MMLGPCRGGAVRLAPAGDVLLVGEGIETCLAAMQATGLPAWAALSTSGLRTLDLPEAVQDVIILADGDDAGEAAARHAALRWRWEGRRARIARAPRGMDFNDLLVRMPPAQESAAVTSLNENLIAAAIQEAEEIFDPVFVEPGKPRLLVENCDPDRTIAALRDVLAGAGKLFDRGVPVRLTFDQIQHGPVAQLMTPDGLVLMLIAFAGLIALKRSRTAR